MINNNSDSGSNIRNNTNNDNHNDDNNNNELLDRSNHLNNPYTNVDYPTWEQSDETNYRLRPINSFETNFRSSTVLVEQNYHSSPYSQFGQQNQYIQHNQYQQPDQFDGFLRDKLTGRKNLNTDMVTNNTYDDVYGVKQLNVKNTTNDFDNTFRRNLNYAPKMNSQAPVYKSYMNQNSVDTCCHMSKVAATEIQSKVKNILETILITNEVKIDFQVDTKNKYQFCGRIYTSTESDFCVKIYRLKDKDKNGNLSVIEMRNVLGDEFGFYELEKLLIEKLENLKILIKPNDDKNLFGLEIGSLTLDDEDDDEDEDNEEFGILDDDVTTVDENDEEFDHNLCEVILETLKNEDSFREEYMHDAYQLATYLEKNDSRSKNMINYILKNESKTLIGDLVKPLKSKKFYCAFIILHVLEAIDILLSQKDMIRPQALFYDVKDIQKLWSDENGIQNNLGSISVKFVKSQQIDKRCESILNKLKNN